MDTVQTPQVNTYTVLACTYMYIVHVHVHVVDAAPLVVNYPNIGGTVPIIQPLSHVPPSTLQRLQLFPATSSLAWA